MAVTRRETIYMLKESGGTMRTNDPRAIPAFEAIGFRRCTREEYLAMDRRMMREEAQALRESQEVQRCPE